MISHRPADARDARFIAKSWVASYRDADTAGCIQVGDWYEVMIPQVLKIMCKPDVQTLVAYETTDIERVADLYGFITVDVVEFPPLVYYVFTKQNYRRSGIARGLFAAAGINPSGRFHYVCSTPMVSMLQRKIPMSRWTPKLGRFPKSERRKAG